MAKRRATLRRRVLRSGAVVVAFAGVLIITILVAWAVPMGDFAPVHPIPTLATQPSPPRLERQAEPHTCGYHAASTVYKAYGLDVGERRLRARLGVDNKSFLYDSTTTGCLHPDIYRAMNQDGFDVAALDLDSRSDSARLKSHLEAGGPALALIRRHDSGVMHWVVLGAISGSEVTVLDPLEDEIQSAPLQEYWDDQLLSVIKVQPRTGQPAPLWNLHLRGAIDMISAFRRSG
ncbi:MAG: cysteine peptidase family C39 domain-containing protein [Phycisphaerales bacterium]